MSLLASLNEFDRGGYWHPETDHVSFYCLIPKNASSWVSQVFMQNQWHEGPIEACPNQEISELIVVLRDPIERWVAGIAQYASSYILHSHWYDRHTYADGYEGNYISGKENFVGPKLSGQDFVDNYNEVVERLLFEQIAFDDHTMSQSWYVNYYKAKSYSWFYLDKNFEQFFLHHYRELNLVRPEFPNYNRGSDNNDVKVITEFLTERLRQRPYLSNNLKRYYKQDYDLISQTDFVYYSQEELKNDSTR